MRRLLLLAGLCLALTSYAQNDSTGTNPTHDTIRVGNLIIVKNGRFDKEDSSNRVHVYHQRTRRTPSNLTTNWFIFDIGFANYNDQTNYASASTQAFAPGGDKDWFRLRTGKSVDVNIWIFMQRLNMIKHVVNLKYGLGIELNNYRYEENIKFLKNPTQVIMDTNNYSKNKLAADYATVPIMLNFNFTPHGRHDFGLSVGASVGYRYSTRQKFKGAATGKYKTYDDFDMDPWKISYIGELQMGILSLYGSFTTKSMFLKGLDQRPYTIGLRFGNW